MKYVLYFLIIIILQITNQAQASGRKTIVEILENAKEVHKKQGSNSKYKNIYRSTGNPAKISFQKKKTNQNVANYIKRKQSVGTQKKKPIVEIVSLERASPSGQRDTNQLPRKPIVEIIAPNQNKNRLVEEIPITSFPPHTFKENSVKLTGCISGVPKLITAVKRWDSHNEYTVSVEMQDGNCWQTKTFNPAHNQELVLKNEKNDSKITLLCSENASALIPSNTLDETPTENIRKALSIIFPLNKPFSKPK